MVDTNSVRKSGRQRVPNKKYQNDTVEALNQILESDSDGASFALQQLSSDDDFPEEAAAIELDDDNDSLPSEGSEGSAIVTPIEDFEDAHLHASSDPEKMLTPQQRTPKRRRKKLSNSNTHSRGMPENPLKADLSKSRVKIFAGEGPEDIMHVAISRNQWADDLTLPSSSLMCRLFSHTEEKRHIEATAGWDWYYNEGGKAVFASRQVMETLSEDEASKYLQKHDQPSKTVLLGPYGAQNTFSVSQTQPLKLVGTEICADKQENSGWIVNVGNAVNCMAWSQAQSGAQYLALHTQKNCKSPAYIPVSGPSSIEFWCFPHSPVKLPDRRAVFYHDWGNIIQLKWCPVPREERQAYRTEHGSQKLSLGLLACISKDGFARVIDIHLDSKSPPHYVKLHSSSWKAPCPSDTLATCLTWLSATDIAVGHADGTVSIFNIFPDDIPRTLSPADDLASADDAPHAEPDSGMPAQPPWLSLQLHPSYILDIITAYPSHPFLLVTTSMSGHLRLTDLRAPKFDYVFTHRTRSPPASIAYHDGLFSVIGCEENSGTLRLWGLRSFYTSTGIAKLPSPAGPGSTMTDVGKFHASVAIGCADGSVVVTNPMRKILGKKEPSYQQCVFKHEWATGSLRAGEEHVVGGQGRQGFSRITQGYKAEVVQLSEGNKPRTHKQTVPMTTIDEEETAVTALAWNPNIECGGWLAVAWGSGLLRVQDLAI
ncbi:hypothetical protein MMC21_004512 [Puttea exsequens]|nr:hypothetical protein [Puttea exsequens]